MNTFLLSKFFSIQKTKKLDKSDLVTPLKGDKKYPYVTRTVNNNGIESYTGYIDDFHLNPGNSFSLGLLQMNFQWHEGPWYCGQFVRRIVPKYDFSRNVMLYFLSVLQKNSVLFDPQAIKRVDGIFDSLRVDLPVTSDGQLDVQYMEQYIKRIEAQYIKRIEAYLSVLGYDSIDDCELSSQDLKVLSGPDEWGKFKIEKFFDKQTVRGISGSLSQYKDSNGYSVYGQNIKYQYDYKILAPERYLFKVDHPILAYASSTGMIGMINENFYRTGDNGAFQALIPKHNLSIKQILYFLTSVKMVFAGFNYNTGVNDVLDLDIMLPVHADGSIAYDYMNNYITAIEKKKVLLLKQHLDKRLDLYRGAIK